MTNETHIELKFSDGGRRLGPLHTSEVITATLTMIMVHYRCDPPVLKRHRRELIYKLSTPGGINEVVTGQFVFVDEYTFDLDHTTLASWEP